MISPAKYTSFFFLPSQPRADEQQRDLEHGEQNPAQCHVILHKRMMHVRELARKYDKDNAKDIGEDPPHQGDEDKAIADFRKVISIDDPNSLEFIEAAKKELESLGVEP